MTCIVSEDSAGDTVEFTRQASRAIWWSPRTISTSGQARLLARRIQQDDRGRNREDVGRAAASQRQVPDARQVCGAQARAPRGET